MNIIYFSIIFIYIYIVNSSFNSDLRKCYYLVLNINIYIYICRCFDSLNRDIVLRRLEIEMEENRQIYID